MNVVEIGILYREQPVVKVSNEDSAGIIPRNTKEKILLGVYAMMSEIYDGNLKNFQDEGFTILFTPSFLGAEHDTTGKKDVPDLDKLVLAYCILNMRNKALDASVERIITSKMKALNEQFRNLCNDEEIRSCNISSEKIEKCREMIHQIFTDLLKTPEERFDSMLGTR